VLSSHALEATITSTLIDGLGYFRSFGRQPDEADVCERPRKSPLTGAQKKALRDQRSGVPAELRAAFDAAFNAWKETWFSGGLAISSDPHKRAVGKEFDALIALGPQILPLVVDKLADADNFLALQLYDAVQPDERLFVPTPFSLSRVGLLELSGYSRHLAQSQRTRSHPGSPISA
jgi:hypothetical protein